MLEKYTHNKFIFLSVQKFIYTVHRYHFVNDPHDLWLSLQNILTLVSKIFLLLFYIDLPYWLCDLTSPLWQSWLATWSPFKCCVSLSPILNGSVHWGIVFYTLKGQWNELDECLCDVFQLYIYFLEPSISFMVHVSFTLDDIMTIMFLQSPTPEISLQHHLVAYRISYVINFIFNSMKCMLSYLLFIIFPILSEPNL